MYEVVIKSHAYKHGLTREEILYAWAHLVVWGYRNPPYENSILAVGLTADGRLAQMVGIEHPRAIIIIHALSPPTQKALRELGLKARR